MTMMTRCRACRAPILWAETRAGKRMPLDPRPTDQGNILLVDTALDADLYDCKIGQAVVLSEPAALAERSTRPDVSLYTSHFATCPSADRFRQR